MRLACVGAVVFTLSACKGDPVRCEQAARNYATLMFWEAKEIQIAKAPATERDAVKQQLAAELAKELESGISWAVQQCRSANNDDQVDCMIAATTAEQARECAGEAE